MNLQDCKKIARNKWEEKKRDRSS